MGGSFANTECGEDVPQHILGAASAGHFFEPLSRVMQIHEQQLFGGPVAQRTPRSIDTRSRGLQQLDVLRAAIQRWGRGIACGGVADAAPGLAEPF